MLSGSTAVKPSSGRETSPRAGETHVWNHPTFRYAGNPFFEGTLPWTWWAQVWPHPGSSSVAFFRSVRCSTILYAKLHRFCSILLLSLDYEVWYIALVPVSLPLFTVIFSILPLPVVLQHTAIATRRLPKILITSLLWHICHRIESALTNKATYFLLLCYGYLGT